MSVIEYGRCVHAEMAAIIDAARRGVSIDGCTLYTTTFPRHECARHIVAAGIRRVVYIDPHPKSLVQELYKDSIALDAPVCDETCVVLQPFVGISPTPYLRYFNSPDRKDKLGNTVKWTSHMARLRYSESNVAVLIR